MFSKFSSAALLISSWSELSIASVLVIVSLIILGVMYDALPSRVSVSVCAAFQPNTIVGLSFWFSNVKVWEINCFAITGCCGELFPAFAFFMHLLKHFFARSHGLKNTCHNIQCCGVILQLFN